MVSLAKAPLNPLGLRAVLVQSNAKAVGAGIQRDGSVAGAERDAAEPAKDRSQAAQSGTGNLDHGWVPRQ
jgi:hypothetical protein